MGRHQADLPPRRRAVAAGLGGATVILLVVALWQLGTGTPRPTAAGQTSTSTIPPTTPTSVSLTATSIPTITSTAPITTPPPVSTASTEPPTTTTTLAPLVLEDDGLGPVGFGVGPEEAIGDVTARLGPATSDSGWVNASGTFGTCPGNIVRVVSWESLRLFFGDGPSEFGEDAPHFYYYVQSLAEADVVIDLTTDEGVGIGSTVEEMTDAYGDRLTVESTSRFGVTFMIESNGSGLLSGTLTESIPTGQVTSIAGGFGCGS